MSAHHTAPGGKITSAWKREGGVIRLELEIPAGINAVAQLEKGFVFEDGSDIKEVKTGTYTVKAVG